MLALMFALFRFEYKLYHSSVLFVSAMLSFVSYSIRIGFNHAIMDSVVTVLLIFAFIHFIFQIQVFYAAIITVTGYVAYGILQSIVMLGLDLAGVLTFDQVKPNTLPGYTTQIVSSAAALLITYLFKSRKIGFAYVPFGQRAFVQYKGLNRLFLIAILLASALAWITLYYNSEDSAIPFFLMTIPLIAIFVFLIYLSIRKDSSND
ncbi:hypothetical protein [Paenibacillus sp. HJGM_3]|uniref:hypothetical protein n=1 Tax=Paenibacillus sp. HJGM_3 TaxID=3379816 RepID=UPI003859A09C